MRTLTSLFSMAGELRHLAEYGPAEFEIDHLRHDHSWVGTILVEHGIQAYRVRSLFLIDPAFTRVS